VQVLEVLQSFELQQSAEPRHSFELQRFRVLALLLVPRRELVAQRSDVAKRGPEVLPLRSSCSCCALLSCGAFRALRVLRRRCFRAFRGALRRDLLRWRDDRRIGKDFSVELEDLFGRLWIELLRQDRLTFGHGAHVRRALMDARFRECSRFTDRLRNFRREQRPFHDAIHDEETSHGFASELAANLIRLRQIFECLRRSPQIEGSRLEWNQHDINERRGCADELTETWRAVENHHIASIDELAKVWPSKSFVDLDHGQTLELRAFASLSSPVEGASLPVEVHEQRLTSVEVCGGSEVDGEGRLPDAALLVQNSDGDGHLGR
jgi:hypothetical protein